MGGNSYGALTVNSWKLFENCLSKKSANPVFSKTSTFVQWPAVIL